MRFIEFLIAVSVLAMLLPILLISALLIKIDSKGPVFFWQKRVGLNGKKFWILKFRTMKQDGTKQQITSAANSDKITKVGHYIRKMHLDEVVQLYNVIKGEMSLVGPRPEVPKYTEYYKNLWKRVLTVRPGITGYATVKLYQEEYEILNSSKNPEDDYIEKILPKKLNEEIFYIENRSIRLNFKIIMKTLVKIIF